MIRGLRQLHKSMSYPGAPIFTSIVPLTVSVIIIHSSQRLRVSKSTVNRKSTGCLTNDEVERIVDEFNASVAGSLPYHPPPQRMYRCRRRYFAWKIESRLCWICCIFESCNILRLCNEKSTVELAKFYLTSSVNGEQIHPMMTQEKYIEIEFHFLTMNMLHIHFSFFTFRGNMTAISTTHFSSILIACFDSRSKSCCDLWTLLCLYCSNWITYDKICRGL